MKFQVACLVVMGVFGVNAFAGGEIGKTAAVQSEQSEGAMNKVPSILRTELPFNQAEPFLIGTTHYDTTMIEFPYAIEDFYGRGFTLNPDAAGGDFVLRIRKGDRRRIGVTPMVEGARRTLHVIVNNRIVSLEFYPAAGRETAMEVVVFYDPQAVQAKVEKAIATERASRTKVTRSAAPPRSNYQDPSAETQQGLLRFMRLLLNMPEDMAMKTVAANPSLQLAKHRDSPAQEFGDFALQLNFAIRDSVTDTLGFCVTVTNKTPRRLLFDEASWTVRSGDEIYPVLTSDFVGLLEPQKKSVLFLVLTRKPDGRLTRLMPENDFRLSAKLLDSVSEKPVSSIDLLKLRH